MDTSYWSVMAIQLLQELNEKIFLKNENMRNYMFCNV